MTKPEALTAIYRGFRERYLNHGELTAQLKAWAAAFPQMVRLTSIGRSAAGHELWLLTIGERPDEVRPAVWVDGNMHASELCGTSVALAIAEDMLDLHLGGTVAGLPLAITEGLKNVLFYILPSLSPDGAEATLTTGQYVRSSPEDHRVQQGHAYWCSEDIDGDGRIRTMRLPTPDGDLVELPGFPGVLTPRLVGDAGPFYRLYPEGTIANFDGHRVPDPYFLSDNEIDLNRNFAHNWAAEPHQAGAGAFPGSTPEARAVMAFASAHPHIYAWLNLHTFGGVMIRPPGDRPDAKMDQGDLAIFKQVEAWMEEHSGYATVSGFHEFLYEPAKPLRGDLSEYAYEQRGCIGYVVELWDLFHQLGLPRRKPFIDNYSHFERDELTKLVQWDRTVNHGRIFQPWQSHLHPQLGPVELGGLDLRVGVTNPPYEMLNSVCLAQSAAFLRVAALLPRLSLTVEKEKVAADVVRLQVRVCNSGYLATFGLPSARALPHSEPLRLKVSGKLCQVIAPTASTVELGHLDGWGRGRFAGSLFFPWTRGNGNERLVTVLVQGHGQVNLSVLSCRTGNLNLTVDVGP